MLALIKKKKAKGYDNSKSTHIKDYEKINTNLNVIIRKIKAEPELNLASRAKDNQKSFFNYIRQLRRNKQQCFKLIHNSITNADSKDIVNIPVHKFCANFTPKIVKFHKFPSPLLSPRLL